MPPDTFRLMAELKRARVQDVYLPLPVYSMCVLKRSKVFLCVSVCVYMYVLAVCCVVVSCVFFEYSVCVLIEVGLFCYRSRSLLPYK